jgi:hypothetical protein
MELPNTIMKKAAPVATTGDQSAKNAVELGLDAGSVTLAVT